MNPNPKHGAKMKPLKAALAASLAVSFLSCACAKAQTYTVLHAFTGQQDGGIPWAGVTPDDSGNLYGVTQTGGTTEDGGSIYKIDPTGQLTTLHGFQCPTGCDPLINPLTYVHDTVHGSSTLYGSTVSGGSPAAGVLFSINTDGSAYTVLHVFDGKDGYSPNGPLQPIPGHGFVGVAPQGGPGFQSIYGPSGDGVLFALDQFGTFKVLHNFGKARDGISPDFVLADQAGNLYVSMGVGGQKCSKRHDGCGTIFKFNLNTGASSVIYSFTGEHDGAGPILGSIGPDGTLYGVTQEGTGPARNGTLFSLTPSNGGYDFKVLAYSNDQLGVLESGPTLTPYGRLIGVANNALYEYNAGTSAVLQPFSSVAFGQAPLGQPSIAKNGAIVGTTQFGGIEPCTTLGGQYESYGCGVVYSYSAP
jgi:uncharacterized repeat protein (TIGR03803 family)